MKYNEKQRYEVIQRERNLNFKVVEKNKKIRESFPVDVEIKKGYYVIESKMNKS